MSLRRRTLLACLPVAAAPGAARAFRLEPPSAATAADYGAGCPAAEDHAALEAEIARLLQDQPTPPALTPELVRLARCPFCGCAVAGATDHGEATPEG